MVWKENSLGCYADTVSLLGYVCVSDRTEQDQVIQLVYTSPSLAMEYFFLTFFLN